MAWNSFNPIRSEGEGKEGGGGGGVESARAGFES